jgi:hypothetical protein
MRSLTRNRAEATEARYRRLARTRRGSRRSTASPARTKARKIRRIGKSANQAATDLGSKSDQQNQIRLQSTRGRRTVHASTDESASWAHDERPPSRRSRRCHHGTPVHARTGKGALQAHDVRSPPDYILFQMDQAGSLRPADEDDRERVRGRRGSPSEEKIRRRQ